jgi:glycogen operon protein
MLLAGDEFGRTQKGNNNAYCQDNELSWLDWELVEKNRDLLEFVRELIVLRRDHPVFRRRHFFRGRRDKNGGIQGIKWFNSNGDELREEEWTSGRLHHLGMLMYGDSIDEYTRWGRLIEDDNFLLLINGGPDMVEFSVQFLPDSLSWQVVLDTNRWQKDYGRRASVQPAEPYKLGSRSLVLMVQNDAEQRK